MITAREYRTAKQVYGPLVLMPTMIATYAIDVLTRQADGKKTREKAWETDVWFKRDGKWKLVHVHYNSREVP